MKTNEFYYIGTQSAEKTTYQLLYKTWILFLVQSYTEDKKKTQSIDFFFLSVEVKSKGVFEGKFSLLFTGNQTLVIFNGCSMPSSPAPGGENFP